MSRSRLIGLVAVCLLLVSGVAISSAGIWDAANVIPSTPTVVKDTHEVLDINDHDADDLGGGRSGDSDLDD